MFIRELDSLKLLANGSLIISDALVLSDLHLGMESALGLELRLQAKQITAEIGRVLKNFDVKKIILNGDIKFEFGKESAQEWAEVRELMEFLSDYEVILIRGNHDFYLQSMVRHIPVVEYVTIGEYLITHGHKIFSWRGKYIIGNEHPVVKLRDELGRIERYRCFLWFKEEILVMPAFNWLSSGTNVLEGVFISPILKGKNWKRAEVFVIDGENIYDFGEIKDILKLMF